jgi:hypothetical protein
MSRAVPAGIPAEVRGLVRLARAAGFDTVSFEAGVLTWVLPCMTLKLDVNDADGGCPLTATFDRGGNAHLSMRDVQVPAGSMLACVTDETARDAVSVWAMCGGLNLSTIARFSGQDRITMYGDISAPLGVHLVFALEAMQSLARASFGRCARPPHASDFIVVLLGNREADLSRWVGASLQNETFRHAVRMWFERRSQVLGIVCPTGAASGAAEHAGRDVPGVVRGVAHARSLSPATSSVTSLSPVIGPAAGIGPAASSVTDAASGPATSSVTAPDTGFVTGPVAGSVIGAAASPVTSLNASGPEPLANAQESVREASDTGMSHVPCFASVVLVEMVWQAYRKHLRQCLHASAATIDNV